MEKIRAYRQGDVIIEEVDSIPADAQPIDNPVLKYGEITGHKHQIVADTSCYRLTQKGDTLFLETKGNVTIVHEEHPPIILPAQKKYRIPLFLPQEYDYVQHTRKKIID